MINKPLLKKFLLLAFIPALIMGCGSINFATSTPVSDNAAIGTMIGATFQALQTPATSTETASPTSAPATSIPFTPVLITSIPTTPFSTTFISPTPVSPTLPPPATFTSVPSLPATRIAFSTGATQSVVTGTIQPGQRLNYVVKSLKDQPVIVSADSPNQGVKLSIFGADGVMLLPPGQGVSTWQGLLPSTQDYYFQVIGGTSVETFTLNMTLVARVQFAAGGTESTLKGQTTGGFGVSYAARALQGQKMDVTLNVPGDKAALTIWGFSDGQPYVRAQSGIKNFSLELPATQDYIIVVFPQGGQVVEYSITIRIK